MKDVLIPVMVVVFLHKGVMSVSLVTAVSLVIQLTVVEESVCGPTAL